MFERYTEKARRVIFFARYEASQLRASAIEAEHILLGLLREDKALMAQFLRTVGAAGTIRREVEQRTIIREKRPGTVELPLSREAKRVLNYAAEESERFGHRSIGTEHLLLGLLRAQDSLAAELLRNQGLELNIVREEIMRQMDIEHDQKPEATSEKISQLEQVLEAVQNELRRWQQAPADAKKRKIRKAVFPAAGLGTRFLPATKAQPKEMLPLVDKPLIQYVVEEAIDSGIEQIIIVTGRGKNSIEDHFDISYELERELQERGKEKELEVVRRISGLTQFAYVRQKQALGLGHAVLVARDVVDEEPFAVMLGDDIIDAEVPCLKQMIDVSDRYQAPVVGIMPIDGPEISRFGVIRAEEVEPRVYRITDMVEKPRLEEAPSNLAIIGRYILTPDIFSEIENTTKDVRGEIQLTDAMRSLLKKRPFYGYQFEGRRYDAGDKVGFLKATVEFALKHDDVSAEFREYLRNLKL
ncbi:MAG: UTP--glucose-1-phosphate uridylyltransferase GalU [Acidobacteria bacterium]|nr:UTP--glucose-1-phosphate uridylyltransferase GalU [Acidobacteriota bacterium]